MSDKPRKLFVRHIVRKIFLEDWAMKLTALVITLGLWFGVTGLSTPTTKRFTVPLNLSISNNAEITTAQQDVEIVVSGDKRKIDLINKADLTANVDLTDVPPGDRVVTVMPENVSVSLPQGVKLIEVLPIRFLVKLEAVEEREIDVKAQTTGQPAAGFEIYRVTTVPGRIRVRGPVSYIATLGSIETAKIDLAGRKEDFAARQIPVSVADARVSVLNPVVDIIFKIGERRIERTFSLPVEGVAGKTASFTVFAPRTLLLKLRPDEIKVGTFLDDSGQEAPQVSLPAELQDVAEVRKLKLN